MGAFLFCHMARNTPSLSVVVLLLIRCLPNVAEEDFTAFRKLVGRNLCQPSAKYWVAFSRSHFSISGGHPQPVPAVFGIRICCLPAKGCGGRSIPSLSSLQAAPFVRQSGSQKCPFGTLLSFFYLFIGNYSYLCKSIQNQCFTQSICLSNICNIFATYIYKYLIFNVLYL